MSKARRARRGAAAVCAALVLVSTTGCVSSSVQKGAAIGAGTGAVLGVGTGALVSSDSLAGSSQSRARGDITLEPGTTILSAALVGAVLGGVVGAMVGKSNEGPQEEGPSFTSSAPAEGTKTARLAPNAF